jgi:FixJ family two-component response regulator
MEDVSRLIEKAIQELGPDASDEEITARVLKTIETLPDSERAEVLKQLVKRTGSRELAHLEEEAEDAGLAGDDESGPNTATAPS